MQKTNQIIDLVLADFKKTGIPCLSDTVIKLSSIDSDSELSMEELANIILEDIGLTGKVIRTVNSVHYRRGGQTINTVTQAVLLLGFNTIREIALNMAVLDLAERSNNQALLTLLLSSYAAAYLAKDLSNTPKGPQRESLFVGSLFYSLGRIIVALYHEDLYQRLCQEEIAQDQAPKNLALNVFKEVGINVARRWKLPPNISSNLEGTGLTAQKTFSVIKQCNELTRTIIIWNNPHAMRNTLAQLAGKTGLSRVELANKTTKALKEAMDLTQAFKKLLSEGESRELLEEVCQGQLIDISGKETLQVEQETEDQYIQLSAQLSSAIVKKEMTLDQIYLFATETLFRGVGVDRAILSLLTKDKTLLIPRFGLGKNATYLKDSIRIHFPPKPLPLKEAFAQDKAVLTTWGSITRLKDHIKADIGQKMVCITPIIVDDKPIGCFLVDRALSTDSFFKKDMLKTESIRDLVVLATMKR